MQSVLIKELAQIIGIDRSGALRLVKKLGIEPHRLRTSGTGNQAAAAVTATEAKRVIKHRDDLGFTGRPFKAGMRKSA